MYVVRDAQPRVANEYTAHDLVLVLIVSMLESRFGLRRDAVAALASGIAEALARPAAVDSAGWLLLCVDPLQVQRLDSVPAVAEGIVFALDPVFDRIDDYLLPGGTARSAMQGALALGPVAMIAKTAPQRTTKSAGRRRS